MGDREVKKLSYQVPLPGEVFTCQHQQISMCMPLYAKTSNRNDAGTMQNFKTHAEDLQHNPDGMHPHPFPHLTEEK